LGIKDSLPAKADSPFCKKYGSNREEYEPDWKEYDSSLPADMPPAGANEVFIWVCGVLCRRF
jgi:hypothetical protein